MDELYCNTCHGVGRISTQDKDGQWIKVDCDFCDGTGLMEDMQLFEKRRYHPKRWDDEEDE
jgi:DnaJ-class molecular chaperone